MVRDWLRVLSPDTLRILFDSKMCNEYPKRTRPAPPLANRSLARGFRPQDPVSRNPLLNLSSLRGSPASRLPGGARLSTSAYEADVNGWGDAKIYEGGALCAFGAPP